MNKKNIAKVSLGASELVELGRKCARGKILRSGFTRSDGTYVAPACVPDKGAPGKTPAYKRVLPTPEPGSLGKWSKRMPDAARHAELKKTVDRRGCRAVIGSLTLLRNLTADRPTKAAAKADAAWVRKQGFCKLKTKR